VGEVEIAVPWDREVTFSPAIVKKRQRRLGDAAAIALEELDEKWGGKYGALRVIGNYFTLVC
jgi:hypothetical protein